MASSYLATQRRACANTQPRINRTVLVVGFELCSVVSSAKVSSAHEVCVSSQPLSLISGNELYLRK